MIPGSGEFAYATEPVSQTFGIGRSVSENVHTLSGRTDWEVALDQMQEALPNVGAVSLVVSWFGTDLRAGHCEIRPGVESQSKATEPVVWGWGARRDGRTVVSQKDGRPAYGGTPSDESVIEAIPDLKAAGNARRPDTVHPDGCRGRQRARQSVCTWLKQAEYPWRGRITVDPAAGVPDSPDKTAAAATQVASFVGTAGPCDFAIVGGEVVYSGPERVELSTAHPA